MTQFEIVKQGFFLTLMNATMAVLMFSIVTFLLLRVANKLSGIHFETAYASFSQNPMAEVVYLSVRYAVLGLGNAIIIAATFMYS